MKTMGFVLSAAMLATATSANAQDMSGPAVQPLLSLAPNTEVVVTPQAPIDTRTVRTGDKFKIATFSDVVQNGYVLIPRGTPGEATVTYRTGKGAFGKSGKMEVEFNWLDVNGRRIPLGGTHHEEGQGNGIYALGALVAAGIIGSALVTGHSAYLTYGQQLRARTVDTLAFNVPVPVPAPAAVRLAALTPERVTVRAIYASTNGDNVVTTPIPLAYP